MAHTVFCVKLKREMPGLDEPPFDNDLGRKVYDNVSQEAWRMWTEHCKMLLNEYRLNPARREDQEVIVKQLDQFFFGEGSAVPKEYVPPEVEMALSFRPERSDSERRGGICFSGVHKRTKLICPTPESSSRSARSTG